MVSMDPPDRNASFSQAHGDGFPVLSDPSGNAARAFGVVGEDREVPRRWTFYVDVEGVIRHIDKSVATQTAGADIARRLDALGFAKGP